jgi:putative transposase
LMSDHLRLMISIPPKYAVSQVVGFIEGKSAPYDARAVVTAADAGLYPTAR